MSERSFRTRAPEDHARERREGPASIMDASSGKQVEKPVKRRGSFSLPMSLRPNSQQKKDKHVATGPTQPLSQQTPQIQPPLLPAEQEQQQQHIQGRQKPSKLKLSLRPDGDRNQPMSPSHSALRLPHNPPIGSAASSIRSFQTDLSSIAEDHALDYSHGHPPYPKLPAHFLPMKSAMKGGSGPPSIISEAVSEESRSSVGAHDWRKAKARVSFTDEQETNHVVNSNGGKSPTKDGFPYPQNSYGGGITTSTVSQRVSPPVSPGTPPQILAVAPMVQTILPIPTPPAIQPRSPVKKPVASPEMKNGATEGPVLKETTQEIPKIIANEVNNVPQVTIHVSPTSSVPPKPRLPGSFPDPSPDPSPPSSAGSDAVGVREMTDKLRSLRQGRQSKPANESNELDLGLHSSVRTTKLLSTKSGATTLSGGENMIRLKSDESQASGISFDSDALDQQKENTTGVEKPEIEEKATFKATGTVIKATSSTATTSPLIPTSPLLALPKPETTKRLTKSTKLRSTTVSEAPSTTISTRHLMKSTLRENGTATRVPLRSPIPQTSRASPVSQTRKPMRMSLRQDDYSTIATSTNMARGLMSLPRLERVPSDSSFKRLKRRDSSGPRTPLQSLRAGPTQEPRNALSKRRDSDSSSDIVSGGRGPASLVLGLFKRRAILDQSNIVTTGSRFQDSSDDDDGHVPTHFRTGSMYSDTEPSPSSPVARRRASFTQLFRRRPTSSQGEGPPAMVPAMPPVDDGDNANVGKAGRRLSKIRDVYSKGTGKEKRFEGLQRLFRIKE